MHKFIVFAVNYLYLDGKPFARGFNSSKSGYCIQFFYPSGRFSRPVYYPSFEVFCCRFHIDPVRFSLGVPFPIVNPSDSDVK